MSLYHEAAGVLESARTSGSSIKTLVYGKKTWKSNPKTLFALSTEAAKWSEVLSEVVEKSGVLTVEKALSPTLAVVLAHDLFLAKKGVALPASHGLHVAVARHRVRLSAELTKAKLRRGCATLDALRERINVRAVEQSHGQDAAVRPKHPRWIRVNVLKTSIEEQLNLMFSDYARVDNIAEVLKPAPDQKPLYIDEHIPDLIAVPAHVDVTATKSYRNGSLILQDKASCFPAYLLNPTADGGSLIDATAAPGNKTTHLAAILSKTCKDRPVGNLIACEKNEHRSQTLLKMVKSAGGEDIITVKAKQDFMKLNPDAKEFANVTALLLDPSCSGSGIVGRDEVGITVHLPSVEAASPAAKGKKRKRGQSAPQIQSQSANESAEAKEETPDRLPEDKAKLQQRLENLSSFQLRMLQRAMAFPAARRITYSTCSIHAEENEQVVVKALASDVARDRGWRIMWRAEQVDGMRRWHRRGWKEACRSNGEEAGVDADEVADACIRCEKGSEDGTMGFFVAGFVRDGDAGFQSTNAGANGETEEVDDKKDESDEEWEGFGDD
ncbi:S-adenosyl-L-methionine-dependent methyltransferase [Teratosphaeria nubilosa]|uniref:S-adenosyl-L-methionine-dependent methyltransferase n=1 Tax=Teratosphaeria nubilosa TaxID=161662 RepID=A0A6G1L446_9PEZI|nr:S-adenosyl-L-methionine-dependent methyltransferase [Teratosphaeria nubilosa]